VRCVPAGLHVLKRNQRGVIGGVAGVALTTGHACRHFRAPHCPVTTRSKPQIVGTGAAVDETAQSAGVSSPCVQTNA
jgi:hypothetical protein